MTPDALNPAAPILWLLLILTSTAVLRRAAAWLVAVEDRRRPIEPPRSHVRLVDGEGS